MLKGDNKVTVELDANEIKNETISKLSENEIYTLGLFNAGVYMYKGEIKTRVKGLKKIVNTNKLVVFENDIFRFEFIKLNSHDNKYAMRLFDKKESSYNAYYPVLTGCAFFKD